MEGCLPSMKEGERILMHFLPHILLHSLIEGNCEEAAYDEFQAVLSTFNTKHELDSSIINVRVLKDSICNNNNESYIFTRFYK